MTLKDYKRKRKLNETPEPAASKKTAKKGARAFVVQKHDARQLHYDFRLELDGVLKSWAVPKGIPLDPSVKHLAIMVEDHPFDYLHFEGVIPKGNYGAGSVMVWDTGVYYPLDAQHRSGNDKTMREGLEKGHITFCLEGQKISGVFSLVKMKGQKENQWLFIKSNEDTSSDTPDDVSVLTNRSMDQIGRKKPIQKKAKMPHAIKPMLASLIDQPFDDKDWLFEIKWDGYRALAEIEGKRVGLYSRNQLSLAGQFPPIVKALEQLGIEAVLDGEIVVADHKGVSNFQDLQNYKKTGRGDLRYYVFDLLYYQGEDLRAWPLLERKNLLKSAIPASETSLVQYSDHILEKGKKFFQAAEKRHLEGIMAKEIHSPYQSLRSRNWLKIKTHARQEAVICGYTQPKGSRQKFGALILGIYEEGKLRYVGHVGGGFNTATLKGLAEILKPLIVNKCPFKTPPETNAAVTWVKPELVCEVSFAEWTKEMIMRQPIFMGIRKDKDPKSVQKEVTIKKQPPTKKKNPETTLTHLDKIYWPKEGYTKGDLIEYYREIAPLILPYLKDRPEILHRFPNGIEAEGFYQKNADTGIPDWVPTVKVNHENKVVTYLTIPDAATLLFAVNLGCIDLNPFSSRIQHLDNPDYMVIDLDPENVPFKKVVEAAQTLHELIESAGLKSCCKTSGGRGLHLYIPLAAQYPFEQVKQFAQLLSQMAHQKIPKFTSMERSPSQRQKKVYFDYLQNNFGQSLAAPYSVRPRPGALVSTPLDWSEVKEGLDPQQFTMKTVLKRLKKKGDLFKPVLGKGCDLKRALNKLEKNA